ncbi:hypothetical protein D3C72_1529430 [compost metagenome]
MLGRYLAQQGGQATQLAVIEQVAHHAVHHVGCCLRLVHLQCVPHRLVDRPVLLEPVPGQRMQRAHILGEFARQARQQHLAKKRMQPIPGFAVAPLDADDEEVVAVELREPRHHPGHGMGLAQQRGAQAGAETLAHR